MQKSDTGALGIRLLKIRLNSPSADRRSLFPLEKVLETNNSRTRKYFNGEDSVAYCPLSPVQRGAILLGAMLKKYFNTVLFQNWRENQGEES